MDLSVIGLGKFEGSLYSVTPQHVEVTGEGNYHVWSSAELDADSSPEGQERRREILETVKGYAEGTANVEKFFGFAPGDIAKRFHIVPAANENAATQNTFLSPSTILITTGESYQQERKMDQIIFGQHEGGHLIARKLGNVDRGDVWKQFYEFSANEANGYLIGKLTESAEHTANTGEAVHLSQDVHGEPTINEKDFFENFTTIGGHAFDNSAELWASQVNSLLDPEWKHKMMAYERNTQFLGFQLQALETLRSVLKDHPQIRSDAPVFDSLNEKILFLQQMLKIV